jgi:hypothetical protein
MVLINLIILLDFWNATNKFVFLFFVFFFLELLKQISYILFGIGKKKRKEKNT